MRNFESEDRSGHGGPCPLAAQRAAAKGAAAAQRQQELARLRLEAARAQDAEKYKDERTERLS